MKMVSLRMAGREDKLELPKDDDRRSHARAIRKLHRSSGSVEPPTAPASPDFWTSEDIFRGHREILIHHNGVAYRLRITSTGKLILTK